MLRLSCVVHGPIYGRFMGFYENGFLSIQRFTKVGHSREAARLIHRRKTAVNSRQLFPSVDQSGRFAGVPNLCKPLYREKTVHIISHKTAINRPVDHTGETQHTF